MIAKVTKGRAFASLARYLETGNADRVAWTETRNLSTDDPHTASRLMQMTAERSARAEKPVYHIALSFDPHDAVDRATMVQVADRLMRDLRLQEHQALIMAHGDTHHPHLHIMINRVHPDTFRAWHPGNDYAQIERSLRKQERELNLRAVPGRHHRVEDHERPDRSPAHQGTGKTPKPSRTMDHQPEHRAGTAESRLHDESRPIPDRARLEKTEAPARDPSQSTEGHQAPERVTAVSRSRQDLRADQVRDLGQQTGGRPHDPSPPAPEPSTDIGAARARVEAFWRDVVRDLYEAKSVEEITQRSIEKGLWGQPGVRPGSPAEQASNDQNLLGGHIDIDFSDIVEAHQPRMAQGRSEPGHPGARGVESGRPDHRAERADSVETERPRANEVGSRSTEGSASVSGSAAERQDTTPVKGNGPADEHIGTVYNVQGGQRPYDRSTPLSAAETAAARARVEAFWRDVVRDMYEATSPEDLSRRMIEKGLWGQEGSRPGSPAEQASKDQNLLGGAPIDIDVSDIVEGRQPRFAGGERGVDNRGTSAPERSAMDAAQARPQPDHPDARGVEPSRLDDRASSHHRGASTTEPTQAPRPPEEAYARALRQRLIEEGILRLDHRDGPVPERSATDGTRERPNAAGPGTPTGGRSHPVDADRTDRVSAASGNARPSGDRARDPHLDPVRKTINHLDRRIQIEGTRDRAIDELDRARVRQLPFTAQRAQAQQASEQFRRALAEVYRDPVAARRSFHAQAAQIAAAELRRHPERFGQLQGTQIGPVRSAERAAALQTVPKLEYFGREYLRRVQEAWTHRAEYRGARTTVVNLERQIRRLDRELERAPRRAQLEQLLSRQLRALQPHQQQRLVRSLPKLQRGLVTGTIMLAREFAHEQGQER